MKKLWYNNYRIKERATEKVVKVKKMKVYVFEGYGVYHDKVYATKEKAEKECEEFNKMMAISGSSTHAHVKEVEFVK